MKKQLLWKGHAIAQISTNEEGNMVYNPDIQKINMLGREGLPTALVIDDNTMTEYIKRRITLNAKNNSVTVTDGFSVKWDKRDLNSFLYFFIKKYHPKT